MVLSIRLHEGEETMARGRPLKPLAVSQGTREELASMARSRSLSAGLVRRAEIVLLCAEGKSRKVALVATTRKLLTILNAAMRDQVPWTTAPLLTTIHT